MTSLNSFKTPLRWPGGKSRACLKMDPYFPDLRNYEEFREPFLGGGSVAIHITKKYPNLRIWVNDLYEPLVNFWQQLQMFGNDLKDKLLDLKSTHNNSESAKQLFLESKEKINDQSFSSFERAASFYVVNKCSFSGLTEKPSFSLQASNANFSIRGIEKLPTYSLLISKWRITNYSYDYLMDGTRNAFMYLDPPYDIKDNLYGNRGLMHKGFNHNKFASDCDVNNMDQLVSYNSDQLVKDRFKNWNAAEFDLTYTMRSVGEYMRDQKQRKELLLFNYGIEGLVNWINLSKENLLDDPSVIKDYSPYIINKCLSFHIDSILFANEMNINHFLDKDMQYSFYLNSLRKKNRFSTWIYKNKIEDLECVKKYYGYSNEKATQALKILTNEQLKFIKQKLDIGGIK